VGVVQALGLYQMLALPISALGANPGRTEVNKTGPSASVEKDEAKATKKVANSENYSDRRKISSKSKVS
jgi:hypothetical protein